MLGSCIWYTLCGWIGANPWVLVNQVILKGWTVCFHDLWRICAYDMKCYIFTYVYIIYIYILTYHIWQYDTWLDIYNRGNYSYERKSIDRSRIGNPPNSVHLVCSQYFPIILVSRGRSGHNGPGVFIDIFDVNDLRMYLCPLMKMCSHHIEILGATCIWHVGMHFTCKIKIACRRKVFASSLKQLTGTG